MWFASAAYATASIALNPNLGDSKSAAIERIAKIYYKIVAYQETSRPRVASARVLSNLDGTMPNDTPWQSTPPTTFVNGIMSNGDIDVLRNDLAANDDAAAMFDFAEFPEMASWTSDDFFGFDGGMM